MCRVSGAIVTPRTTSRATISAVNGRLALGISALPGVVAKTVWYASAGQSEDT